MTAEELIDMLEAGGFSVSTIGVGDGTVKEIEIDVRRWGGDDGVSLIFSPDGRLLRVDGTGEDDEDEE